MTVDRSVFKTLGVADCFSVIELSVGDSVTRHVVRNCNSGDGMPNLSFVI